MDNTLPGGTILRYRNGYYDAASLGRVFLTNVSLSPAPSGIVVPQGGTVTIDVSGYASDGDYAITCSEDWLEDDFTFTSVTQSGDDNCTFELEALSDAEITTPQSVLYPYLDVTFVSSGGDTVDVSFYFAVVEASDITYTAAESLDTASGKTVTLDAAVYSPFGDDSMTCSDPIGSDSDKITFTRSGCDFTVTAKADAATGATSFKVYFTTLDGRVGLESFAFNITSTAMTLTSPAGLSVAAGGTIEIDAGKYAKDSSHVITCGAATVADATKLTVTRPDVDTGTLRPAHLANSCVYRIVAASGAAAGATTFTVPYTSTGGDTHTGTVTVNIGADSDISYTAPTGLARGIGQLLIIDASDYASDGSYAIGCQDATGIAAAFASVIRTSDCNFRIRMGLTQGAATFVVPYVSSGGDTHSGMVSVRIGPDSQITITTPSEAQTTIAAGLTRTIDFSDFATDGTWTISCAITTTSTDITLGTATGCSMPITSGNTDTTAVVGVVYTSAGGHQRTAQFTLNVGGARSLLFSAPVGLQLAKSGSLTVEALDHLYDAGYTVTCADATSVDSKISVSRSGCDFTVTAGTTAGEATFTVPFNRQGGTTFNGTVSVVILAFAQLDAAGCTDGTFVDTTANPIVVGANNDLVNDCQALVAIQNSYAAVGGNDDLASTAFPRTWGTGTATQKKIANWTGVTVAGKRVTQLILTNIQLEGSITADYGRLTALTHLLLYINKLSGSLPPEIGNLTNLVQLNLVQNDLTGSIPVEIGRLTKLTQLGIDNNELTGSIPTEIGNLTSLTSLNLDSNELSGSIPAEIGNLTSLVDLQLNDNQLTGSIPAEIGNLTRLSDLGLHNNQLSGAIPSQMSSFSRIRTLELRNNELTGSIPAGLASLASTLRKFSICGNKLTGDVPTALRSTFFLFGYPHTRGYSPVQCQRVPRPLDTLNSASCTNGTYVDLRANPRVTGNNNDLVEDCLALVAAHNAMAAASENQLLPDAISMRNWGATNPVFVFRRNMIWEWNGVTVSGGRVTSLDLSSSSLGGPIPSRVRQAQGSNAALSPKQPILRGDTIGVGQYQHPFAALPQRQSALWQHSDPAR